MTSPAEPELHPLAVRLGELGDRTARQVLDVLAEAVAGTLDLDQLPELAAVLAQLGGDQAAVLAVTELSADLAAVVGPSPDLPDLSLTAGRVNVTAVEAAAGTVIAGPAENHAGRLSQLVRSVVAQAGQEARGAAVRSSPLISGWSRGLDSKSCQLCRWWWREGRVWPKSHHMPRHPGCTCVQVPELVPKLRGVSDEAYAESSERAVLDRTGRYLDAFGTDRRHTTSR